MKDKEIKMKLAQSFNGDQAKLLQEMLNKLVGLETSENMMNDKVSRLSADCEKHEMEMESKAKEMKDKLKRMEEAAKLLEGRCKALYEDFASKMDFHIDIMKKLAAELEKRVMQIEHSQERSVNKVSNMKAEGDSRMADLEKDLSAHKSECKRLFDINNDRLDDHEDELEGINIAIKSIKKRVD